MIVGVPTEVKDHEYRVSLTPSGAAQLRGSGHTVIVQRGAGVGSGFPDEEYLAAGAELADGAKAIWAAADLVVKVKEPIPSEYPLLRPDLALFTYLHLAAAPGLAAVLVERRVTGIAYETVQRLDGVLPLLTPMSEVAGRMATQVGAHYLEKAQGGRGLLLGGVPGVLPADVVILGSGVVGTNAAQIAVGMGADVTIVTKGHDSIRRIDELFHGRVKTLVSTPEAVRSVLVSADLVIGAALIAGARAPMVVTRAMVQRMRPGSVIVDVAVDQGGCIETTRPTTHTSPTYVEYGIIHYAVTNMPGAVPYTSARALCNETLPYVLALADQGVATALQRDPVLARGLNTHRGRITHPAVAAALEVTCVPVADALKG